MEAESLDRLLLRAEALRRAGRWEQAKSAYAAAELLSPDAAAIKHNLAICLLGTGHPGLALEAARAALELDRNLWQARVVLGKALTELGMAEEAAIHFAALFKEHGEIPAIRLEFAATMLHELGQAFEAAKIVSPLRENPACRRDAILTGLMASLYDRDTSAQQITGELRAFSRTYIEQCSVSEPDLPRSASTQRNPRIRIGLMSPMFSCSPVYFFCIGALRLIAAECDLIFVNRGRKEDWATREFQRLACEWLSVGNLDADALATALAGLDLDVLLDMGGWSDVIGLQALTSRPARRQYKWVGGQSATTGLRVFDGILSDKEQTPPEFQHLYSEKLVMLDSGYVTYTAPDYLPQPVLPEFSDRVYGIISNPAKISRDFLADLTRRLASTEVEADSTLRFIDRRYVSPQLRQRIEAALQPLGRSVRLEFVVPESHEDYLRQVGRLGMVLDTFPYTGGLTTMEALSLGVPCRTRVGTLFCERHTYAHCLNAGLNVDEITLDTWQPEAGIPQRGTFSLVQADSPRLNHERLAECLLQLFDDRSGLPTT